MTHIPEQKAVEIFTKVAQDALPYWGLSVDQVHLGLIKYRENGVFEVRRQNGLRTALRLHRIGYHSDGALRSELEWMKALSENGIAVPTVIPTDAGELFIRLGHPELEDSVQIDMFEWVEGDQLGSSEEGVSDVAAIAHTYGTMGELAAQVHNQAASWTLPDDFERHAWDEEGLLGDDPFWGRFWEIEAANDEQRQLLQAVRKPLHADLSALSKDPANYSMIHADFAPENILVDGDRLRLIDFDDAGFGWHVFELATSLFFIIEEPYFEQAKESFISGYHKHREMSDDSLKNLDLIMLARSLTYIGWMHTRSYTETAKELTPWLLDLSSRLIKNYLD